MAEFIWYLQWSYNRVWLHLLVIY